MPMFNALVRPILEYATPVWTPFLVKHNKLIESIQRRFTKHLCGMRKLSYGQRIRVLGTCTLSSRRNYLDLVELYKIMHGLTVCGQLPTPNHTSHVTGSILDGTHDHDS